MEEALYYAGMYGVRSEVISEALRIVMYFTTTPPLDENELAQRLVHLEDVTAAAKRHGHSRIVQMCEGIYRLLVRSEAK